MDSLIFGVLGVLGGAAAVFGILYGWPSPAERRARALPVGRAADARTGEWIKLEGEVATSAPIKSELNGDPLAFARLIVKAVRDTQSPEAGHLEEMFRSERFSDDLRIQDASGGLGLDPSGADLRHARALSVASNSLLPASAAVESVLAKVDLGAGFVHPSVQELRFLPGDAVFAIGRIEQSPTGRVLTGGADLLLCGGKERDFLRSNRLRRGFAAALVVGGTALAGLAAYMLHVIGG